MIWIYLFTILGISLAINLLFFLIAYFLKQDTFTDITYSLTFLLLTIIALIISKTYYLNQILVLILISFWSIRLGTYLLIRIWKTKIDHRFDKIRNKFWSFGIFWFFQGITVWIVNMPSIMIMLDSQKTFLNYQIIFFILAFMFIIWEMIADLQKYFFNKKYSGQFINIGLWKISRHPNYFGEIMFWIMLTTFVLTSSFSWIKLISLISPIFIIITLYFITGVPILERNSMKKFKNNQQYLNYVNKTSCLVPFIGIKGYKKIWDKMGMKT